MRCSPRSERGALAALALAAALAAAACATNEPWFFDDPEQPLPRNLSELELDSNRATTAPLRPYEPTWPLWSSGSEKRRLAFLPAAIDTSDSEAWSFSPGTTFLKTFSYAGEDGSSRPIETRVLRLVDAGWTYDVYRWASDGSDAKLADIDQSILVEVVDERQMRFEHRIPSRLDCRTCHESAAGPVLGFSELQLDDDSLAALDAEGLRSDAERPPERIRHEDPTARAVLGMFHGNCVHCHNGGNGPSASFDLRHSVAFANTIDRPTESSASAAGIRIAPGRPERSILFLAYSGETDAPDVKLMPPLGVDRRDADLIAVLRDWIEALPRSPRSVSPGPESRRHRAGQ